MLRALNLGEIIKYCAEGVLAEQGYAFGSSGASGVRVEFAYNAEAGTLIGALTINGLPEPPAAAAVPLTQKKPTEGL